jgi:hypothetical protein
MVLCAPRSGVLNFPSVFTSTDRVLLLLSQMGVQI